LIFKINKFSTFSLQIVNLLKSHLARINQWYWEARTFGTREILLNNTWDFILDFHPLTFFMVFYTSREITYSFKRGFAI